MSDRPSGAVWKQSEHHATWLVGCSLNRHRLSLTVGYPVYQQPKRKLMLVWSGTDVIGPSRKVADGRSRTNPILNVSRLAPPGLTYASVGVR